MRFRPPGTVRRRLLNQVAQQPRAVAVAIICGLAATGWLGIGLCLAFGSFWAPSPPGLPETVARSAVAGRPEQLPAHLRSGWVRPGSTRRSPEPSVPGATAGTRIGAAPGLATPPTDLTHKPSGLASIRIPAWQVDSAAPATSREHLLPTVVEPGPDGADWNVLTDWSDPTSWPQRGAVLSTTLRGRVSGLSEHAYVYLPSAYFDPAGPGQDPSGPRRRNLPLAVVFSGYPGDADRLINRLHYPAVTLAGIQDGTIAPTVLVMLSPSVDYPWDTECTDIPDGPQAFTFYDRDVPDAVVGQFALRPQTYAAIGDSTGGYCAAKLEAIDPTRFPVAASLSGYFQPATDPTTRGAFNDSTLRERNDLGWRLQHLPVPAVSLLLATATDEGGDDGYATNQEWLHLIHAPMTARELVLDHGGHNFNSWNREIPYALSWITAHLPRSRAILAATPTGAAITGPATFPSQPITGPDTVRRAEIRTSQPPEVPLLTITAAKATLDGMVRVSARRSSRTPRVWPTSRWRSCAAKGSRWKWYGPSTGISPPESGPT
ncbi:MAG TPA: alpha/beta hydrolase-fold protein [Sporichthyaceae bacterium]|nr:alpha/beta hydrolase-fold protein [Sporichthyaceae bacterium]